MTRPAGITQAEIERAIRAQVRTGVPRELLALEGGWTCCVEQGQYGHYARKPTWLYAVRTDLPELRWGKTEARFPAWAIEKHGLAYCKRAGELAFKGGGKDSAPRIGTPPEFRDLLIAMARSAQ